MNISSLINDPAKKAKEKSATLARWLGDGSLQTAELMAFAEQANETDQACCMEAIEFATKKDAKIADELMLEFATDMLLHDAPRVKWESAKVLGNIAHLFPAKLKRSISALLENAKGDGTVVRWACAFALGEILKLKTKQHYELLNAVQLLYENETDNGIKTKYMDAVQKAAK